ncbi:MAG: signal peptidase I [Cellulosilyticaceae bacterium]
MKAIKNFFEFIKEPLLAVLAALLISQFLVSHTRIPSGSMEHTIETGDHLIVNRIPFYYRDPVRGEIIVFRKENENLIKRVIGEPGDIITIENGKVLVNGTALEENDYVQGQTMELAYSDITFPYNVPEGEYFVMGDNRQNSQDSRYFGSIQREQIFAKGGLRIYPFNTVGMVK